MVGGRARRRAKMRRKESVSSGGNSFGRENEELSVSRRLDAPSMPAPALFSRVSLSFHG